MHKWTSGLPTGDKGLEVMRREWGERLEGLIGEQVATGLREWKGAWPPSVDEFRSACEQSNHRDGGYRAGMYSERPVGLPEPQAVKDKRREVGLKRVAEIKKMLRGKK